MTCNSPTNTTPIRNLYFECQESILDNYNIPDSKRIVFSSVHYLAIPVDPRNYTRIEEGQKTQYKDTFKKPFITPSNVRVGFQVRIDDNLLNVRRCLEFLALSSASTSYGNNYIPVKCLDYVRPEIADAVFTTRQGLLTISAGNGNSGSGTSQEPLYTEDYEINFLETFKRFVM